MNFAGGSQNVGNVLREREYDIFPSVVMNLPLKLKLLEEGTTLIKPIVVFVSDGNDFIVVLESELDLIVILHFLDWQYLYFLSDFESCSIYDVEVFFASDC